MNATTATGNPGICSPWLAVTDDGALAVDGTGPVALHDPAASPATGLVGAA